MRYRVNDLPVVGRTAFTPLPTTNPVASSYGLVKITAAMGLQPTPVGDRDYLGRVGNDKKTMPSNCAPNVILPDQYIAYANNMGPTKDAGIGMAQRRMNPLPVPAISGIYNPGQAFKTRKTGGRVAMVWPRTFQRWGNNVVKG